MASCKACAGSKDVCDECAQGTVLSPSKLACSAMCPAGSYTSGAQCLPCDASCASCSTAGADKCLSCPAEKALKYTSESSPTDGTCVDECKANTGGCETCGATIGGSKYCSRCGDAGQAPLNGDCAANARTSFCDTITAGVCTQCANGYFLLDGGCYEANRQPGKSVCTTTDNNGQCQTCANGQNPSSGNCPACPAGCSKCSGSGGSQTCSECLAGYYLSTNKCVKCSENSTNGSNTITGVPNCVSCDPPVGDSGPVTCYVTQEPTVDPADPSVNKGGLSSGAIAGISVAVIAVVGGLVGFLCWWFICRGKA